MRIIGALVFFLGVFICGVDIIAISQGDFNSTLLAHLIDLSIRMGHQRPEVWATFWWAFLPISGGVIFFCRTNIDRLRNHLRQR